MSAARRASAMSAITDVGGILVGQHHRLDPDATLGSGWASGTTVVLTPPGTVGAVDVPRRRAGHPRDRPAGPDNTVRHVDAVVLTGGSAFGLAAADGVMSWLEEHDRGVAMDGGLVPIVPAAVIFDLPVGGWQCRPTAEFGYAAAEAAGTDVAIGTVGAGVGARAGVLKGGVGTASMTLDARGHRRRARRRQRRRRRRRPGHRAAVAGRPDRGVRADRRRRPTSSPPSPTGTPSSARSTPPSPWSPPTPC